MPTISSLQKMKQQGEKITMLTVYDAVFSHLISDLGVDVLLVGDSLGTTVQGHDSTVPVQLKHLVYHTECVRRGMNKAFLLSDLPFMSYATVEQALKSASKVMQAGANMVKLEGGMWLVPIVQALTDRGIPVCGHLGLTPQSVNKIGGYRVQGRSSKEAQQLIEEAVALEQAGAQLLVLECVPRTLAKEITYCLSIPVIGIGAGPDCDGQVLVLHDMLGITPGVAFKFTKNFMAESPSSIAGAIKAYKNAVKNGDFPAQEHCFE